MCYLKTRHPVPAMVIIAKRYPPDVGLLTSETAKHDDELNPRIIAPDPFALDDCLHVFSPTHQLLLTTIEDENTMNTSEDEPSSGLNGRLRPRRSTVTSPHTNKAIQKPEPKTATGRQKRTNTPSKASTTKPDDLANKSDSTNTPQLLCPYCDRKFAAKQTASQHVRRVHLAPKQDAPLGCLFCNHAEPDSNDIIRHMVDSHPNQYFACLDCHTRFLSTSELAEHKLNVCEKQKVPYRSKLRQKVSSGAKKTQKSLKVEGRDFRSDGKDFPDGHRFNGVVISCELKPSQVSDEADIEDNITTNLILPPSKNLGPNSAIEKSAVIVLDDIQWNKRMPTNFSFHNTDADQILSRLGVVHRSPRTGESTKKDWLKCAEEATQKFEKCFDTTFYSKVASNVHENMSKFLDGSFNFNPDPDSIIKTRKSKNSVVINAAEGFPILLAYEQYSRSVFDGYLPRALAPKHKWKWENEKISLNPDDIKHDTHVNNCIITLVSSLDIWTQLCMRRKYEDKFSIAPLEKKTEKQNAISKELKEILESRELPSYSQHVVKFVNKPMPSGDSLDFPASLGLRPSAPSYDVQPAVLSGEWVRPRCYVCCACGAQTRDSRGLSSHISTQHPNAQVQHYEIVGELLLNADILKHLYVPPSQMCNRTRPLRGFRECTKCKKSISLEDLHQHMLDCAGDTPAVRRKVRYRPFGVRRRRTRLPDNTIRKKIRKDIRTRQTRQKTHMRPRPKIRTEVGDAETIRKMLADLPAKRHRVMVNPMNSSLRPRRKLDKQRNKIIMKRRSSDILKNRKQRNLKEKSSFRTGWNSGDNDDNDTKNLQKSDDENKPLKPKVKTLKITHSTRQSEALKRKVALNRAKRRAQIKGQKAAEEQPEQPVDAAASSSSGQVDQMSIDNTSQRIDVTGGPYNTREHSSRGRSNNRDDQKPGPSSQDGNTHNSYAPPQNIPLKHSIARLTADNDMHDKNMQLHHLYLMPSECNEVTQHVPTGQQRLFENEAVVTKLDKPPLHFNPSGPADPFACQKSKQCNTGNNKRKGLNDCIAMLKNKAGQTAESSDSLPCNNEDRSNSDAVVTTQTSPNLDFQMNMNYDTRTRPAEIFSRHQLIPDRFIDYHPESNVIAQNFADLPFHYLPSQRLAFDLPQPDSRNDSCFVKPTKQKQNEGNQKTARRRSTRAEKEQSKRQEYTTRTSSVNYPVDVSNPSKVAAHSRRASTQSVEVSTSTVVSKRRSSGTYSQSSKTVNDYRTEAIMSRQKPLEYHPQRVSTETHMIELNPSEAYMEAQKNLQKEMIACAENYMNQKQLTICVDTNYTNKKPNELSPEDVYMMSKQAISPGSNFINKKQAAVGSDGSHINKHKQAISPVEANYMKNKQVSQTKESNFFHNNPTTSTTEIAYDKAYVVTSPETDLVSKSQAASYVESAYENTKVQAISAEKNNLSKALVVCPENFVNKTHAIGNEGNLNQRTQASPLTESNFVNTAVHGVSETNFVCKKQTTSSKETNLTPKTTPVTSGESNFITKKRAATSESSVINKKQLAATDSAFINKKQIAASEFNFDKIQAASSESEYVNRKQALESNLNRKQATTPESDLTNKKLVSTPEDNYVSNTQPFPTTDSDKKLSVICDEIYLESGFKNLPANIPPAYPSMAANFVPSSNEIEAPLDLSKSTNENPVLSEKDDATYGSENFDNYETLDLSHKVTDSAADEINDVVDLRVKVTSPNVTLDMSTKLPSNDDMDSATDLSIKVRDDDTPTDLTVRKKTNDNVYEYDPRNLSYENVQEFVQDLRKTHPEKQPIASNIPTDLSGRSRDLPLDMVGSKAPSIQTHAENLKPADLSVREQSIQNRLTMAKKDQNLIMTDRVIGKKNIPIQGKKIMDCVHPTSIDESPYVTKAVYDANVHQPFQSTSPMSTSIPTTVQVNIVTGKVGSSNTVMNTNVVLPEKIQILDRRAYITSPDISTTGVTGTQLVTVSHSVATTISASKYESTAPVYTLANACISMTKIEPSSAVPSSGETLNIPNTTVVSAAPVYTLTDTTVNPTINHGQVYNNFSQDNFSATINTICNTQIATEPNVSGERNVNVPLGLSYAKNPAEEQKKENPIKSGDVDPETAKKIAMLPKELVEILGTMPVDHRNQLLNVLPQYVSTPGAISQNEPVNNSAATNTSTINKMMSPSKMTDSDIKPTLGYSPVSSSQSIRPSSITHPIPAVAVDKVDEIKSFPHHSIASESISSDAEASKNKLSLPRVYEVDGNTVIDLTEDEPANADIKKIIVEPNNSEIIPSNELGGVASNNNLNKQKVSDQTASLRAVRIKAPSERNKSSSIENNNTGTKNSCQEQQVKSDVPYMQDQDTDVNKTLDLDKTLAIQQAEISSTQHNTSIAGHKYPLAISPSSTEYSGDESSKHIAQPSPIPVGEIEAKKIDKKNNEIPKPKTGIVTSSITTKVINISNVDNNLNTIIDTNTQVLPKPCEVDNNDSLLISKSKESDSPNCEVTDFNAAEKHQIEDLALCTKEPENEEDSEDDMCLAAIIKQKLRDQVKFCKLKNEKPNQQPNKKRKKERKSKKVTKKIVRDKILEDIPYNELKDGTVPECPKSPLVNEVSDVHNDTTNQVVAISEDIEINKHSKKRPKRGRRSAVTPATVKIQSDKAQNIESDNEINKENDVVSKFMNNKTISDYSTPLDIKSTVKVSSPRSHDVVDCEDVQNEGSKGKTTLRVNQESPSDAIGKVRKLSDDIVNSNSIAEKGQGKPKGKKKQLELSEANTVESADKVLEEQAAKIASESTKTERDCGIESASIGHDKLNRQSESEDNHDRSDILNFMHKKDKKPTRSKKHKNEEIEMISAEIDVTHDDLNSFNVKENTIISTPLRRSRRGKSLFLESISTDTDLCQTTPEQKTPLTKKQLILSKLRLLDEESPIPAAHSTPAKLNTSENELDNSCMDKDCLVDCLHTSQESNIKKSCETIAEKPKGTKRRICTQFSRKSKKKKSIEEQNKINEDLNTDNAENIKNRPEHQISGQNKSQSESSNEFEVFSNEEPNEIITIPVPHSPVLSTYKNISSNKNVISTEKRKINNQISFDLSQSSKPKKCKMTKGNKKLDVDLVNTDSTHNKTEDVVANVNKGNKKLDIDLVKTDSQHDKTEDVVANVTTETKTACYNLQVPARRARSKSVVYKSSGAELYDPYDIDLEDMAEQNETFKRKQYTGKNSRKKSVNFASKERNKHKDDLKSNSTSPTEQDTKAISLHDDDIIDSDDSSRSDIPLQKYIEEKEKKNKSEEAVTKNKQFKFQLKETKSTEIKSRRSSATDKTEDLSQTEAEQELRSEKFMQSFGFFSEKKPRKSNLAATKKISETINITNESDDMYFGFKERSSKRNTHAENKKKSESELSKTQPSTSKKVAAKRGRKKKVCTEMMVMPRYCELCKKEFRRSDNYIRHILSSIFHLSKLSDAELKIKTIPVTDEPNYLIAYRMHLDRYKRLLDRLAALKKKNAKAAAKIHLPVHNEILEDVNQTILALQVTSRSLSKDEALFLDCCELLKGANKGSALDNFQKALDEEEAKLRECVDDDVDSITAKNILESEEVRNLENDLISGLKEIAATRDSNMNQERANNLAIPPVVKPQVSIPHVSVPQVATPEVIIQNKTIPQMSSISSVVQINQVVQEDLVEHTVQMPEAATNRVVAQEMGEETDFHEMNEGKSKDIQDQFSSTVEDDCHEDNIDEFDVPNKSKAAKAKKHFEVKEKMYPDIIEDIDMFEDKFDKIKRKCRSQAAAAKQPQPVIEPTTSFKGRRKSEKKKGKRSYKKAMHQNTQVPTKGALKGFDGIKVSIPTSDINLSSIVPVYESLPKKKKKTGSKRKRDKKDSESSGKYDSDHRAKDGSGNKKVDVYEFMDNEDAELFEFRPSTLMERFKSISNNKDTPGISTANTVAEDDNSSDSASDGDDFVYMSDDYVCSDDETENSILSCEMGNAKIGTDIKKISPQKRKDVIEKNAVMGKIFKHNAVRAEKKPPIIKETAKPKANLDQLFDSLLEEEPNSSLLNSETLSPKDDDDSMTKYSQSSKYDTPSGILYDQTSVDDTFVSPQEPFRNISSPENSEMNSSATISKRLSSPSKNHTFRKHEITKKYDPSEVDYVPSTSKKYDASLIDYGPSTSKKYDNPLPKDYKDSSPKSSDSVSSKKSEEKVKHNEAKTKKRNNSSSYKQDDEAFKPYEEDLKSPASKPDEGISTSYDYNTEFDQSLIEDTGVARHRARRKCTVGKQNVLAETWSSESEPDGGPPRPNSAESVVSGVGRKKKGRKKDGQQAGGRRGNGRQVYKKQDVESRVGNGRAGGAVSSSGSAVPVSVQSAGECAIEASAEVAAEAVAVTSASEKAASAAISAPSASPGAAPAVAGPSGVRARRSAPSFWSAEDDEQERLQQHGWIVGDSHKKLVTMLAHAKGRKRNDDKRHLVE